MERITDFRRYTEEEMTKTLGNRTDRMVYAAITRINESKLFTL